MSSRQLRRPGKRRPRSGARRAPAAPTIKSYSCAWRAYEKPDRLARAVASKHLYPSILFEIDIRHPCTLVRVRSTSAPAVRFAQIAVTPRRRGRRHIDQGCAKTPKVVQRRTNFEFYSHTELRKSGLLTIRSTLQVIVLRFYTATTHDPKATFDLIGPRFTKIFPTHFHSLITSLLHL
jgi:hypothetical protein